MARFLSNCPEETKEFGKKIGEKLKGDEIIALFGELGAGKTTLIKGMVAGFGIKKVVKSPSFVMIAEYEEGRKKIYHIDLYRLREEKEAEEIGLFDYLNSPGVKVIEWAEKIENSLPKETIRIYLKIISEKEREIIID
ncbi:MAG: tRNA (adenosine(37)-N6)-threonylcarbamoyltransferase complex ATPase subunit type 1 TsaE [candidate division WOR-3 bacterium]